MSVSTRPKSSAEDGTEYQSMPQLQSKLIDNEGHVTLTWYRYFQSIWLQICSGTSNQTTLHDSNSTANNASAAAANAQTTANNAANSVVAEQQRATTAETNLQLQVSSINGEISNINSTLTGLQNQINTINSRLAAAGIP